MTEIPNYKKILKKAKSKGIKKLYHGEKKTLSWKQWNKLAESKGYQLASLDDLKKSGIYHGEMVFWNPVSREDKIEDYALLGNHDALGVKIYSSHLEKFGPVGWDKLGTPKPWKPF